ncbi:hypothetical protein IWW34DRAFT_880080 [Fusarium oxysporum f. sp. albedinis]|nr:hypothetical protein IWW34DRAFT_880080 [Fusarium oxysporum f. sp. albedinis]KAK2472949.1 hypothetical protein H9L39_15124 [Fusarium oxysporum f. sp. albedinis]
MHVLCLFMAALAPATLINGSPILGHHEQRNASIAHGNIVSHVLVKRDVPLTARDIEEADQHGVDLNKMYKHSILKHSDGSDYSIWVHSSFNPNFLADEESGNDVPDLGKRWDGFTGAYNRMPKQFKLDEDSNTCSWSDWVKRTDKHSAFAGGADAIIQWTRKNRGGWKLGPDDAYYSSDILVGGSNTGANMRFSVRKSQGRTVILGTKDVGGVTRDAFHKFRRKINGVWRMAGKGKMRCWTGDDGASLLRWEIDRSDRDVEAENPRPPKSDSYQSKPKEQAAPSYYPQTEQYQEPNPQQQPEYHSPQQHYYQPERYPQTEHHYHPQTVYYSNPVTQPKPPKYQQPYYPPEVAPQPKTVHHIHHMEATHRPRPVPPPVNHVYDHKVTYRPKPAPTPPPPPPVHHIHHYPKIYQPPPPPAPPALPPALPPSIPPGGYRPGEGPPGYYQSPPAAQYHHHDQAGYKHRPGCVGCNWQPK